MTGDGSKLTLADIADLRAYERDREEFRDQIIELKRVRRVAVGPFVSFVFENRDTVRFQIQEMARAERLITDEAIEIELATYNPLVPGPGELTATMFIELIDARALEQWLPRLVGIETEVELRIAGTGPVRAEVDPAHARQLTRDTVTASVHYVSFRLERGQLDRFRTDPVALAITHPSYRHAADLSSATVASLAADLETSAERRP